MQKTSEQTHAPLAASQPERGAVAIIVNGAREVLLHLRDDIEGIAWPGYWSLLGGGCDPGETPADAIVRELHEEAGLEVGNLAEAFAVHDEDGSGQMISFFVGYWDGDEQALPLNEGVKLQFFPPHQLSELTIPPYISDGIRRAITDRPT
ncbi:NUDIX hydrolase [Actinomadura sp. 1N219]|uniref:NUDIX hydrolase n=1 Tax=Actinomadura sp. 1N219 TaxID=3375152 RepID=UPI0037AADE6F